MQRRAGIARSHGGLWLGVEGRACCPESFPLVAAESWDLAHHPEQGRCNRGQDEPVFCHLMASGSSLPLASLLPPTAFLQSPNSLNRFLFLCQETPVPERTQPSCFTGWQLRGSVLIRALVPNLGFSKSQVGLYELLTMFGKAGGNCSRPSKSAQANEDSHPLGSAGLVLSSAHR